MVISQKQKATHNFLSSEEWVNWEVLKSHHFRDSMIPFYSKSGASSSFACARIYVHQHRCCCSYSLSSTAPFHQEKSNLLRQSNRRCFSISDCSHFLWLHQHLSLFRSETESCHSQESQATSCFWSTATCLTFAAC